MSTSHHNGSCLCGRVRFEVTGDFQSFYLCHCEYCQKDTGSAHASNLFSTSAQIEWISGSENVQIFRVPMTRHVRSFCRTCGSALPTLQMEGQLLVVPAGCLDSEVTIRPDAHVFCSSRASWDAELEDVPTIAGMPS